MVRKKNSKALFEILSQGRGAVEVPDWIRKKNAENQPESELSADDAPAVTDEETPAGLVEDTPPTAEEVQNIEPEVQHEQSPDIELQDVPVEDAGPQDETPELKETGTNDECSAETAAEAAEEDQSATKTASPPAELFTTEQDATENPDEVDVEADEDADVEDTDTLTDVEDEDIDSPVDDLPTDTAKDASRRIKHKLPYDVPHDVPNSGVFLAAEPFVKVEQDRIRISMTRLGAMVVLGAVLVFLVAAFAVGIAVGRPDGDLSSSQQQQLPPKDENLHITGQRVPPTASDNDVAVLVKPANRTSGRYYFILEKISGNGDVGNTDAEALMNFLRERGFPSQLVDIARPGQPKQLALWGLHGFKNENSNAARKYKQNLARVGKEYFRRFGKYKCDNPQPRRKT